MKPLVHFVHGNGFPSSCYRQFLQSLSDEYDVSYIEKVGHNPKFPVEENWHNLVDEVVESIAKHSYKPVIAVGHSLGGILSFLAAVEKPELIKGVIMIDSPIIGPVKSMLLKIVKMLGLINKVTPAERTRGRRAYWPDKDDLMKYLKSKPIFQTFSAPCLQDYIDNGVVESNKGFNLAYDRHVEYLIYRTIPHILPQYAGRLVCPCTMFYGMSSNVVDFFDLRYMRKKLGIRLLGMTGSHMLPFEYPLNLAEKVNLELERIETVSKLT